MHGLVKSELLLDVNITYLSIVDKTYGLSIDCAASSISMTVDGVSTRLNDVKVKKTVFFQIEVQVEQPKYFLDFLVSSYLLFYIQRFLNLG